MMRLFFILLTLFFTTQVQAGTVLNGVADYVELKRSVYLAALYLDKPSTNAEEILASAQSKKMVFKVSARRLSARSFSQQWSKGLLINHSEQELETFRHPIEQFTHLIKGELKNGDEVEIIRSGRGGAVVRVNKTELLVVNQRGFFDLLLGVWIGPRPPSSSFKADLLSVQPGSEIYHRYEKLGPSPKRKKLVKSWVEEEKPSAISPDQQAASPTVLDDSLPKETVSEGVAQITNMEPVVTDAVEVANQLKKAEVVDDEIEEVSIETNPLVEKTVDEPVETETETETETENELKFKPEKKEVSIEPEKTAVEEAKPDRVVVPTLEGDQDLLHEYQQSVVKKIKRGGASYYASSLRQVIKKADNIVVLLNKEGDILSVSNKDNELDVEQEELVKRSVEQYGSFPAIPEQLKMSEVEVIFPGKYLLR
jgi:hypothetical protein